MIIISYTEEQHKRKCGEILSDFTKILVDFSNNPNSKISECMEKIRNLDILQKDWLKIKPIQRILKELRNYNGLKEKVEKFNTALVSLQIAKKDFLN